MSGLPSAAEIISLAGLITPGLIILSIRGRAITWVAPDIKGGLISYALISAAYFAIATPLFHIDAGLSLPYWLWATLQYALIPTILGVALAYVYQSQIIYRAARFFKLELPHHAPTAWDYVAESIAKDSFVLVTLNDRTVIAGKMTEGSFTSSRSVDRDIFIQEMWEVGGPDIKGEWQPMVPTRGILICGGDIRYIEMF